MIATMAARQAEPGSGERSRVLDEVSTAVAEMARRHCGALIVIEGTTGLEDVAEAGVRLDAVVSAPLLLDIFYPNAPLHDKAVVIRRNRIAAASCPLPTAAGNRPRHLGMRHKAGLGISEVTDAVSIVVSEERGTVSIGIDGHLLQLDDPADIRFALLELVERGRDFSIIPGSLIV
jgi:diadenylate cyclase